jgi:hypothetical protein
VIREDELVKRLTAYLECKVHLPMAPETAAYVVRALAPKIAKIVKEEVAEDRRKRPAKVLQA